MLITLKEESPQDERAALLLWLTSCGLHPQLSTLETTPVIGVESTLSEEIKKTLKNNPIVADIIETALPFKMVSRAVKKEPTKIQIGEVVIGGDAVVMIAGPCAIESEEQLVQTALGLKKSGVKILRASAFKPRSSPYSFQGMGHEGLKMHKRAQEKHGLLIETEVMDPRDVAITAEHVDILRVGARNMQNFDLLKELGKCNKPVILKRGMSATIEEWLLSAEYIMAHGNPQVILCERGIRTFETATRSTLDLSSIAI
ncbi:MAG: 3-deoxy-7-phosphoheptulonate synthase, partial [Chlamydiia bacterium]|nr:3-deoxy-7-phosphoheptulonate synthase [Chlamydiia bacterium]